MDYDSSISYLEEGHNVRITRGGVLYYNTTSAAGGLSLNELDISAESSYRIADYILASLKLINAIDNDDGDLSLKLSGIYADGDNIVVTFGYACSNVTVVNDGKSDLFRFEFNSGKLVKAEVALLCATRGKRYEYVPQAWEIDMFNALSKRTCAFIPAYKIEGNGKTAYVGWNAFAAREGAGE